MKVLNILSGLAITLCSIFNTVLAAPVLAQYDCNISDVQMWVNSTKTSATLCENHVGNDQDSSGSYASEINNVFGTTGSWSLFDKLSVSPDELVATSQGRFYVEGLDTINPFVIVLKAGPAFSAYYFNFLTNGTGEFTTEGINRKLGQDAKDISHISVYTQTISAVPVPAAAWLMAPVFAGFMFRRRKA